MPERFKPHKWIHGDRTFDNLGEKKVESLLQEAEIGGLETIKPELREWWDKLRGKHEGTKPK